MDIQHTNTQQYLLHLAGRLNQVPGQLKRLLPIFVTLMMMGLGLIVYLSYLFPEESRHWWLNYQRLSLWLSLILGAGLSLLLMMVASLKENQRVMANERERLLKLLHQDFWNRRYVFRHHRERLSVQSFEEAVEFWLEEQLRRLPELALIRQEERRGCLIEMLNALDYEPISRFNS